MAGFETIKGWLLGHLGKKVIALLLAAITWVTINDLTSYEDVVKEVPLVIQLDEGWAVQERSVSAVSVLVRGSQNDIRLLDRARIQVVVDLRGRKVTDTLFIDLLPSMVESPKSVRPVLVDPGEVRLVLDREQAKTVPITVDILGQPPEGFEVEQVVSIPADATLQGPERRIQNVEGIRTAAIDLEGRLRSFALNRDLVQPSDSWTARLDPPQVRVEVTIVERSARKNFEAVPVGALLPAGHSGSVEFFPAVVNVALKGRADVITNLTVRQIKAFADCSELAPGERKDIPVRVPTPGGVDIIGIDPAQVRAEMSELPEEPEL